MRNWGVNPLVGERSVCMSVDQARLRTLLKSSRYCSHKRERRLIFCTKGFSSISIWHCACFTPPRLIPVKLKNFHGAEPRYLKGVVHAEQAKQPVAPEKPRHRVGRGGGGSCASLVAFPSVRAQLGSLWSQATAAAQTSDQGESPTPIKDAKGQVVGLQLSAQAVEGLQIKSDIATRAIKQRSLPPQSGTINYDTDRLFSIPSRFNGELVEVAKVDDEPGPSGEIKKRPLRYGDRVKQGQLLAVVYSQPLGAQKAALVDAMCSLRSARRHWNVNSRCSSKGHFPLPAQDDGAPSAADSNAVLTAERARCCYGK